MLRTDTLWDSTGSHFRLPVLCDLQDRFHDAFWDSSVAGYPLLQKLIFLQRIVPGIQLGGGEAVAVILGDQQAGLLVGILLRKGQGSGEDGFVSDLVELLFRTGLRLAGIGIEEDGLVDARIAAELPAEGIELFSQDAGMGGIQVEASVVAGVGAEQAVVEDPLARSW